MDGARSVCHCALEMEMELVQMEMIDIGYMEKDRMMENHG